MFRVFFRTLKKLTIQPMRSFDVDHSQNYLAPPSLTPDMLFSSIVSAGETTKKRLSFQRERATREKRSAKMPIHVILLDIEGTTTSINFVKDVLFKFIRETLLDYLESSFENVDVQNVITSLRSQALDDVTNGMESAPKIFDKESSRNEVIRSVVNNVLWNMQLDRKVFALKQLQGQMWRAGYESGAIIGHFYEDVKPALEKWTSTGKKVYIYSSGSVEAQKLLFTYNVNGDMSCLISGHFDTAIGHKIEAESYRKIAEIIGNSTQEILFLTDNPAEAVAASEAALQTKLLVRPGNAPLSEEFSKRFDTLTSFDSLDLEEN